MLGVFERAGFDAHRQFADGVIEVELSLDATEAAQAAIEDREQRADARSVGRLLAPSAVAVIAGEGPVGDPARAVFANLITQDFAGPVVRVGTEAAWSVPASDRIEDVPDAVDLAVVAVAPAELFPTLEACAAKGVRGVVLLTPVVGGARRPRRPGPTLGHAPHRARRARCGEHRARHPAARGARPGAGRSRPHRLPEPVRLAGHRAAPAGGRLRARVLQRRLGGGQGRPVGERPPAVVGAR